MEPNLATVNDYLVSVFNDILVIEESELKLSLTKQGKLLFRVHQYFHRQMIKNVLKDMSAEEEAILLKALKNLHDFLQEYK